ncbi:endo/exonuclease/phosphatase domain-containing protein [Pycnococcus provasolii]
MRLATWNVYSGALCQPRLLALQEQILHMTCPTESSSSSSASPASQGVDVCCLQEVTAAAWAAWRRLKETFPYHVTSKQSCESSSADFFTAILSKYPLQDVKYVEFRNSPQERGLLLATVVPGGERVHDEGDGACRRRRRRATSAPPFVVATTHLESPLGVRGNNADRREEQLRFSLREISKQLESHTIATCLLLGDLNWHPHLHEPLDDVLGTVSHNDGSQQVQMQPPRSASGRGRRTRRRISADSTSSESHWQADGGSAGTIAWRDGWSMLGRGEEGGATYDSARCATCGDDKPGQSRLDRVVIGRRRHNAAVPGTSRMAEATPTSRLALRLSRMNDEGNDNDNDNDNDGGEAAAAAATTKKKKKTTCSWALGCSAHLCARKWDTTAHGVYLHPSSCRGCTKRLEIVRRHGTMRQRNRTWTGRRRQSLPHHRRPRRLRPRTMLSSRQAMTAMTEDCRQHPVRHRRRPLARRMWSMPEDAHSVPRTIMEFFWNCTHCSNL